MHDRGLTRAPDCDRQACANGKVERFIRTLLGGWTAIYASITQRLPELNNLAGSYS
jgi:hypothetical protein